MVLEQSWVFLKFWDTTSIDLRAISEGTPDKELSKLQQDARGAPADSRDESNATQMPFLKESFPELMGKPASVEKLNEVGRAFLQQYSQSSQQKLLAYLKTQDNETALNALFVLSEEN